MSRLEAHTFSACSSFFARHMPPSCLLVLRLLQSNVFDFSAPSCSGSAPPLETSFFGNPADEVILCFHNFPHLAHLPPPFYIHLHQICDFGSLLHGPPALAVVLDSYSCFRLQFSSCRCPLSRQLQALIYFPLSKKSFPRDFLLFVFIFSFYLCLMLS